MPTNKRTRKSTTNNKLGLLIEEFQKSNNQNTDRLESISDSISSLVDILKKERTLKEKSNNVNQKELRDLKRERQKIQNKMSDLRDLEAKRSFSKKEKDIEEKLKESTKLTDLSISEYKKGNLISGFLLEMFSSNEPKIDLEQEKTNLLNQEISKLSDNISKLDKKIEEISAISGPPPVVTPEPDTLETKETDSASTEAVKKIAKETETANNIKRSELARSRDLETTPQKVKILDESLNVNIQNISDEVFTKLSKLLEYIMIKYNAGRNDISFPGIPGLGRLFSPGRVPTLPPGSPNQTPGRVPTPPINQTPGKIPPPVVDPKISKYSTPRSYPIPPPVVDSSIGKSKSKLGKIAAIGTGLLGIGSIFGFGTKEEQPDVIDILPSNTGSKIAKEGAEATGKIAVKEGAQLAGKRGLAATAKGAGKFLGKKLPLGLGLGIAGALAYDRFKGGDMLGAGLEGLSGIAAIVPGIGTAVSAGLDMVSMARDTGLIGDKTTSSMLSAAFGPLGMAGNAISSLGSIVPTSKQDKTITGNRSTTNNNLGNLRQINAKGNNAFIGTTGYDEKGFNQFETQEQGVRALFRDINTKISSGNNTPRKIVEKFAPASDSNDVGRYLQTINQMTGLKPDDIIRPEDSDKIMGIVKSVVKQESGKDLSKLYSEEQLTKIQEISKIDDEQKVKQELSKITSIKGTTPEITSTQPTKTSTESTSALMVGNEPFIEGKPLSKKQITAVELGMRMGNSYSPQIMDSYNKSKSTPIIQPKDISDSTTKLSMATEDNKKINAEPNDSAISSIVNNITNSTVIAGNKDKKNNRDQIKDPYNPLLPRIDRLVNY